MVKVQISYLNRNNVQNGKTLEFSTEFINDDLDAIMEIIRTNFTLVANAAEIEEKVN